MIPSNAFKKTFGFEPHWVPIEYSNQNLWPFEGGCLWSGNEASEVKIQLRASFKKKERLLGIYSKEEIVAHELVHAVRWQYDEPRFEEILAYQTSGSFFRRYFGPLFRSSGETLLSLFSFILPGSSFYFPHLSLPFFAFPLLLMTFFLTRLIKNQSIYRNAVRKLSPFLGTRTKEFTLFLKDKEIVFFSKLRPEDIQSKTYNLIQKDPRFKNFFQSN